MVICCVDMYRHAQGVPGRLGEQPGRQGGGRRERVEYVGTRVSFKIWKTRSDILIPEQTAGRDL